MLARGVFTPFVVKGLPSSSFVLGQSVVGGQLTGVVLPRDPSVRTVGSLVRYTVATGATAYPVGSLGAGGGVVTSAVTTDRLG